MLKHLRRYFKQKISFGLLVKRANRFFLAGCFSLIALFMSVTLFPTQAQQYNSPFDQLTAAEQVKLRKGQPVVTGEKGNYVARVLVTASPEAVLSVLTDYESYPKFIPHVVSEQVLQTNGNTKIVQQKSVRRVFLFNVHSQLRSAFTEISKNKIDFHLIEGDHLKKLQGYWILQPLSPSSGASPNQVLVTEVVETEPTSGTPEGTFYSIFKDSLGNTLSAIREEVGRRTRAG
jgi:ribosome-associated toxin RatA of RatAB toxin-antitoxin module